MKKYERAYFYSNEVIRIRQQLGDEFGLSLAYHNLAGLMYEEKGLNPESILLFQKALDGYQSCGHVIGVIQMHHNLGLLHRLSKDYTEAKKHLLLAENLCEEIDDQSTLLKNKEALYNFYHDLKDWKNAFIYYDAFITFKDSMNSLKKTKIIEDLQTKYDTKELKRENELAKTNEQLSEEKAKRSESLSILIFTVAAFCLIAVFLIYLQYRQRKKKEVVELKLKASERQLELEKQNRLSELKALKSQMNPHFVFNSLNSIQDLILQDDRIHSIHYLGKLSELTRKILEQSNQELTTLKEEVAMMKLYANLEKLRFGDELDFKITNQITAAESVEILLPTMFIQPYIENAFKHGLIHKEGEKTLCVDFRKKNEFVICTIEDNGVGRKKASEISARREEEHLSFSTVANMQRIDLLNEQQENNIRLEIIDKTEGNTAFGTIINIYFQSSLKDEQLT